jgi:hypothetical protein
MRTHIALYVSAYPSAGRDATSCFARLRWSAGARCYGWATVRGGRGCRRKKLRVMELNSVLAMRSQCGELRESSLLQRAAMRAACMVKIVAGASAHAFKDVYSLYAPALAHSLSKKPNMCSRMVACSASATSAEQVLWLIRKETQTTIRTKRRAFVAWLHVSWLQTSLQHRRSSRMQSHMSDYPRARGDQLTHQRRCPRARPFDTTSSKGGVGHSVRQHKAE